MAIRGVQVVFDRRRNMTEITRSMLIEERMREERWQRK